MAFVDESGDTGRKILNRSSLYFVVAIIIFDDNDEAQVCDGAIEQLRNELYPRSGYEFHYAHSSMRVKEAFLRRIYQHSFTYHAFVIDKISLQSSGEGLKYGKDLHRFAILRAIELSRSYLDDATVTIDDSGERKSKDRLTSYLRQNLRGRMPGRTIANIKTQDSTRNNLLQLADYVAGIVNRSMQGKRREENFLRQYLMRHEVSRIMWP